MPRAVWRGIQQEVRDIRQGSSAEYDATRACMSKTKKKKQQQQRCETCRFFCRLISAKGFQAGRDRCHPYEQTNLFLPSPFLIKGMR